LLEFYANSIAHLLPIRGPRVPFHKAHELETGLPRLRVRKREARPTDDVHGAASP
jgi:hypothetical protein